MIHTFFSLFSSALLLLCGCGSDHHSSDHGGLHIHQPLRGGVLMELGKHGSGYNLEILQNPDDQLEIFILDAHAENYVRIAQHTIELTLTDSNQTISLGAVSDPATGETVGNSALFRAESNISSKLPLRGTLHSLKIGSKTYNDQPFEFSGNPQN
jgi:hypothetical protein